MVSAFSGSSDYKDFDSGDELNNPISEMISKIGEMAKEIYSALGPGHSESVYHNAFEVILRKNCIDYETERIQLIYFEGHVVGNFRLDLVIKTPMPTACTEDKIIVELKSISKLKDQEILQVKNYMKTALVKHAVLINFGPSLEVKMVS